MSKPDLNQSQTSATAVPKRFTHSTIAGLEDLTAVLIDLHLALQRLDVFIQAVQGEIESIRDRTDVATDITNIIRSDLMPIQRTGISATTHTR